MSSSTGLWLRSSRSTSPRVPTVEYARSERSTAKSSQAARNSALSRARSSASRRRQAGSSLKKVNLTKVRSAIYLGLTLAVALLLPATSHAQEAPPRVIVALLDSGAEVSDFEPMPAFSPGAAQRRPQHASRRSRPTSTSPRATASSPRSTASDPPDSAQVTDRVPGWAGLVERADDAPADIKPGLLAQTLEDHGIAVRVDPRLITPAIIGANRAGVVDRSGPFDCETGACAPWRDRDPRGDPPAARARRAAPRRRHADRLRAAAAGRARGAGDRDRGQGLRRHPDLRQHPHRRLRHRARPGARRSSTASGSTPRAR